MDIWENLLQLLSFRRKWYDPSWNIFFLNQYNSRSGRRMCSGLVLILVLNLKAFVYMPCFDLNLMNITSSLDEIPWLIVQTSPVSYQPTTALSHYNEANNSCWVDVQQLENWNCKTRTRFCPKTNLVFHQNICVFFYLFKNNPFSNSSQLKGLW